MFSAHLFDAKTAELAEKWTSPRPPRERLPCILYQLRLRDTTFRSQSPFPDSPSKSVDFQLVLLHELFGLRTVKHRLRGPDCPDATGA